MTIRKYSRAVPILTESRTGSKLLFGRISFTRTGSRFARKCSGVSMLARGLALSIGFLPFTAYADHHAPADVHFENSCAPEAAADFDHAVTLLHSFEYPEAPVFFNKVIDQDPDCALAHWGVAMTIWHPLWAPPSAADLEKGAAALARTDGLQTTPREAAYIDALKTFYSSADTSTHRQRAGDYEKQMSAVYAAHLDDPEAAVFYALSILASADPRDKTYAHQYKSAALLNWVRHAQPTHPGVLHYLIHAYDFPGLAHLALDAAKTYADAAPDSTHAQHMPSHIFTRLGLWDRSLSSNHDSTASAADYTQRAQLPGHYDEGIHSSDYLVYAMLQTARDDEARAVIAKLANIKKTDTESFKVAFTYAASPARYALERRQWREASELEMIREDFPWENFPWAQAIHYYARGIGAARSGQLDKAKAELATLKQLQKTLPKTTLLYWKEETGVAIEAVEAWILFGEGKTEKALRLAKAAADREDAVDKHPVTPGETLPARELYADMLFESGDHEAALREYRHVLAGAPNRLNALVGAMKAAGGANDSALAAHYSGMIAAQIKSGNPARVGLGAAR